MSNEFKSTRRNSAGATAPILLVGAPGSGKETNFLKLMSSVDAGEPLVLRTNLFTAGLQDVSNPLNEWSATNEAITNIEFSSKDHSFVIAVFDSVDQYHPAVFNDLVQKLSSRKNDNIVYVLSCVKAPEVIESSPGVKDQVQIVQLVSPSVPPVLQVEELDESPFHEYSDKASFLAKYPQQINDPKDAQMLTSLADLMKAVEGIEGGILGQEACDRGMDGSVIKSLGAFARAFKGSENEMADGIARAVIKELLACHVEPKFIEVNPQQKRPAPDSPTLG